MLSGKTITLNYLIQVKSSQSNQFYMVVVLLLFSSMFHHCFLSVSFKFHNYWITRIMLYLLLFCAWIKFYFYLHIFIYSLFIHGVYLCIPLYSLSSFTQYSVAKSREGVVQGIMYECTVHTFIPYIDLNSLVERPKSLVREIYCSPHIPLLELLLHLSIFPLGTSILSPLFGRQKILQQMKIPPLLAEELV